MTRQMGFGKDLHAGRPASSRELMPDRGADRMQVERRDHVRKHGAQFCQVGEVRRTVFLGVRHRQREGSAPPDQQAFVIGVDLGPIDPLQAPAHRQVGGQAHPHAFLQRLGQCGLRPFRRFDPARKATPERREAQREWLRRYPREIRELWHFDAAGRLLELLGEVGSDAIVARDAVEAAAATYLAYYRRHLETEERDVLPRAAAMLAPADWQKVADALPAGPDPLFDDQIRQRYRTLSQRLAAAAPRGQAGAG